MVRNAPFKITELYAFVSEDPGGTEGIMGFMSGGIFMPMIGADFVRIHQLVEIADKVAKAAGRTYQIRRFIPADPHVITDQFK